MADKQVKDTKYQYVLNSNLVLQGQNRDGSGRGGARGGGPGGPGDLPSGEGESLAGRQLAGFGDRAVRERPSDDAENQRKLKRLEEKRKSQRHQDQAMNSKRDTQIQGIDLGKKHKNETHSLEHVNFATLRVNQDLIYRPRTKETTVFYEQIVHMVQRHLGDFSIETVKDAVDEVLAVLKDDSRNDKQRRAEIDGLLGLDKLTDDEFNNLTVLSQQLTDYASAKEDLEAQNTGVQGFARGGLGQSSQYQDQQQQDIAIDLDDEDENSEDSEFGQVKEIPDDQSADEKIGEPGEDADEMDDNDKQVQGEAMIGPSDSEIGGVDQKQSVGGNPPNAEPQLSKAPKSKDVVEIQDVDAHWIKRKLSESIQDLIPEDIITLENKILTIIGDHDLSARECEKKLFGLLTHKRIDLVRTFVKSRYALSYGTLIRQAQSEDERAQIEEQMRQSQVGRQLLMELNLAQATAHGSELVKKHEGDDILRKDDIRVKSSAGVQKEELGDIIKTKLVNEDEIQRKLRSGNQSMKLVDLELLKFQQGSRLMANKKCTLPKGSTRLTKPGYEEVYVPAIRQKKNENEKLVPINSMPEWARCAFPSYMTHLNRIQSKLYKAAFETPENLLVCAPTGAGKTNIAMLACLQLLGEMRTKQRGGHGFNLRQFKIIYIAPMKALVSEIVGNFQARLESFGIKVKELTGDVHLTKQQIEEANVIVTTPEKWDIITRKSGDRAYVDLVKLIIIDEVHLLHDSRGPVLEAIISRTIRQIEETSELVRIVGLSATLPNYEDVAALLRVDPREGLYYFDATYRPVPLEQIYVGITEKKAIKRMMLMNEVCYEKVMERAGRHQVLVFAHSRKETARTAKIIRDMALAQDKLSTFVKEDSESKKILVEVIVQKKLAVSRDLQDLVPYGIGIHHAGLSKDDRTLIEDLFAAGHIQVLVSTATLAWGVNLPAHTVIIKGTQIYSPEQGKWVELSPQDILQMMGRAGRPQYDTMGEGIILTNHADLQYYLSLNNQQLPIESQLIHSLPDQLNAEVVLGTVSNIKEAVNWLSYTYLYIRMRRNSELYGVNPDDYENDPTLIQTRMNLAHSAALKLQKSGMIKYERRTGTLFPTALGKVASHYYIKCDSMQVYNEELKPHMNTIDLFRLFALSKEFENIPIRENEKVELQKFIDRVPIPVKGGIEETATKINILLQAYIARFRLEGYDLNADMVYVTQSASRIMRALFEIALKKGWAQLAENLLNSCKMVERRQWYSMTPLRQFASALEGARGGKEPGVSYDLNEIARRIERKEQFRWNDFFDFSAQRIGELIKYPKMGKVILGYVHKFPRLEISAFVQPITRSTVRIELELKTHEKFQWDSRFHGFAEPFWILVQDGDSEQILHYEQFILKENQVGQDHHLSFTVPLFDPLPPQYFIKVLSDRWLQAEHVIPVSFKNLILPEKYAPPTQLLDMHQKLISDLDFEEAAQIYEEVDEMKEFSPIQTQAFDKLYHTDSSVFVAAPTGGSERRVLAELAIFREIQKENFGKIVYISPKMELCKNLFKNWSERLGEDGLGLNIELLRNDFAGQIQNDLQALARGDIIICTPEKWDFISRKWRQRKQVQQVSLYIFDNIHLLHESHAGSGAVYEVVMSRVRSIQSEMLSYQEDAKNDEAIQKNVRIVGLSSPLANAKDVSDWLGIGFSDCAFNFHPSVRASCPSIGPLQVHIQAFDHNARHQRVLQMRKPIYNTIKRNLQPNQSSQAIVFVTERQQARLAALDILNLCASDDQPDRFLGVRSEQELSKLRQSIEEFKFSEETLVQTLECGIAYMHEGQPKAEVDFIKDLYRRGVIRVLIATSELCWSLDDVSGDLVIIQDPEKFNGFERRYQELPIADLLQMQSLAVSDRRLKGPSSQRARRQGSIAKCVIMCHAPKKEYFAKFIQEPLPIESSLAHSLHDHLNAEIVSGTVETIQDAIDWITWTFMYRRIVKNPNYYEIAGRTGQHINDFLSELIEDTVAELAEAGCITVKENEMDLEPANLGRIAAFYYIKHQTIETFAKGLDCTLKDNGGKPVGLKMRQLLNILAQSTEYQNLLDPGEAEETMLLQLAFNLPFDISSASDFSEPHVKANILLQSHFSRKPLPVELRGDQRLILEQAVRLVHAMVDVISSSTGNRAENENDEDALASSGNLRPAILCMELSQMIVQALWTNQSPLLQLPYLDKNMIERLKAEAGVEDIADFMNMDDSPRERLVPLSEQQMASLAGVCNRYPNLELAIKNEEDELCVDTAIGSESPLDLVVTIRRDIDEADFSSREEYLEELKIFAQPVDSRLYPLQKDENWWVLVGQPSTNRLLSIKKITNMQLKATITQTLALQIHKDLLLAEKPENQKRKIIDLKVYLICDSYVGCDLEKSVQIKLSS